MNIQLFSGEEGEDFKSYDSYFCDLPGSESSGTWSTGEHVGKEGCVKSLCTGAKVRELCYVEASASLDNRGGILD